MTLHNASEVASIFFFLPRCSHTWERAPASEHRADGVDIDTSIIKGQIVHGAWGHRSSMKVGGQLLNPTGYREPEMESQRRSGNYFGKTNILMSLS
jgi:hypothetical protein